MGCVCSDAAGSAVVMVVLQCGESSDRYVYIHEEISHK